MVGHDLMHGWRRMGFAWQTQKCLMQTSLTNTDKERAMLDRNQERYQRRT